MTNKFINNLRCIEYILRSSRYLLKNLTILNIKELAKKNPDNEIIFNNHVIKLPPPPPPPDPVPQTPMEKLNDCIPEMRDLTNEIINYDNYHYKHYTCFYNYYIQEPDFEDKMANLLRGLPEEDKKYIKFIFARLMSIFHNPSVLFTGLTPFSDEELEKQKMLDEIFIIETHEDYFSWRDYKLPVNFFLPEVLYDEVNIPNLKNKDYFANKDLIDAGACIGDSSIIMSKYTSKNVYAFEPASSNYDLLLKTIELNDLKNVIPVKKGLGDCESELSICIDDLNIGAHTFISDKQSSKSEIIKLFTLDSFVAENNLDVGLIKMDVEGFEQNILRGSIETIKKFKPTLIISVYHTPQDFFEIKPMIENLNLGYNLRIVKTHPDLIGETVLICEQH